MLQPYLSLSRTVHLLCVGALINRAGSFLAPFLTLYLRKQLGLGIGFATSAMAAYGAGALVASLVGGHLADRIGRKTVMMIALFGGAAILVLFAYLAVAWQIFLAIFVFAALTDMYRPAASAMIADVTNPGQRAHAFGLMYVAINLGFAIAAAVGGMLAEFSFVWLFWGDALTAAAFGLLILLFVSETLPVPGAGAVTGGPSGETAEAGDSTATADGVEDAGLKAAIRHILGDRVFLVFCAATFTLALLYMQAHTTFPLYLDSKGYGSRTYGWIIAVNGALIVLCQLPITSFIVRFHRGWMITLAAIILGGGFAMFAVAASPWHFVLAVLVWTTGEMMSSPLSSAIVSDLAPARFRARYMGVFTMSFSSSMMAGAPLGGLVLRELGGVYLWLICGLLGLITAGTLFAVRGRLAAPADAPI